MTSKPVKYKRRQLLINPGFQFRFMAYMAIIMLLGFAIMYVGNYFYFNAVFEMGVELDLDASHPYFAFIERQRTLLLQVYLGVSLAAFATLMVACLLLSHRIAGPVYRVGKFIDDRIGGADDLQEVKLRQRDFFPELADKINALVRFEREKTTGVGAETQD